MRASVASATSIQHLLKLRAQEVIKHRASDWQRHIFVACGACAGDGAPMGFHDRLREVAADGNDVVRNQQFHKGFARCMRLVSNSETAENLPDESLACLFVFHL